MPDVLDRIQNLLALAVDNPEGEEARSAAVMAAKLIRQHGVRLSLPSVGASETVADATVDFDTFFRNWNAGVRGAAAVREREQQEAAWRRSAREAARERVRTRFAQDATSPTSPTDSGSDPFSTRKAPGSDPFGDRKEPGGPGRPFVDYDPFDFK